MKSDRHACKLSAASATPPQGFPTDERARFGEAKRRLSASPGAAALAGCVQAPSASARFLARVASPAGFDVLFEHLPQVHFFVKDRESRFVRVNQAFVELVGASHEDEVIDALDSDFFPADLARTYVRDDAEVMRCCRAIVNKVELVRNLDGTSDWFCTTKVPLLDGEGAAIGVCGITRRIKRMDASDSVFSSWSPALESLLNDYANPLCTSSLAKKMALSVSQFNRLFRRKFGTTPRAYLANVRMHAACHLLVTTDLPLSQVALRTGFYDQSHFSNQFARHRGMPPSRYRIKYAQGAQAPPRT